KIKNERQQKDEFFAKHQQSPLVLEDKEHFRGLNYFTINEELNFVRIEINEFPSPNEEYIMQTNTGAHQTYTKYGKVVFPVNGKKYELIVYTNPSIGEDYYFIPFWDETVLTQETYGAGRYLELEKIEQNSFILDFNKAYNPYCAYSPHFSCPLTPPDNRLKVRIEAGEKTFK
ncbi:MAG: DUF1684 domain-containing protein, partial [Candidatus Hodarchaeales archaeon]